MSPWRRAKRILCERKTLNFFRRYFGRLLLVQDLRRRRSSRYPIGKSNALEGLELPPCEWSTFVSVDELETIDLEGLSNWEGDFKAPGLSTPNDNVESIVTPIPMSKHGRGKSFAVKVVWISIKCLSIGRGFVIRREH